jgi:predicted DNA-binding transcriptional regulator AlpA
MEFFMTTLNQPIKRILRSPEVCRKTGLSISWIHELMRKKLFPQNFKIVPGGRASGWDEAQINAYIESRVMGGQDNEEK